MPGATLRSKSRWWAPSACASLRGRLPGARRCTTLLATRTRPHFSLHPLGKLVQTMYVAHYDPATDSWSGGLEPYGPMELYPSAQVRRCSQRGRRSRQQPGSMRAGAVQQTAPWREAARPVLKDRPTQGARVRRGVAHWVRGGRAACGDIKCLLPQAATGCPAHHAALAPAPLPQALNYGQAVFEGMKAQRSAKGRIVLFRPDKNAERLDVRAGTGGVCSVCACARMCV